nr:hypothetical protein [Jonesia denitrificans]
MIGPLSDTLGRRRPLLLGTFLAMLAAVAAALAPRWWNHHPHPRLARRVLGPRSTDRTHLVRSAHPHHRNSTHHQLTHHQCSPAVHHEERQPLTPMGAEQVATVPVPTPILRTRKPKRVHC